MPKMVCVFKCNGTTEILDLPGDLADELFQMGKKRKEALTDILVRACGKYGVSVEAVERCLTEDC